jgi:DNA-binding transcriptional MerR regulator
MANEPNIPNSMKTRRFYIAQEVADILGISKQTLFRYEKKNIFPKPGRHPINHWRQYTEEEILKLKGIMGI